MASHAAPAPRRRRWMVPAIAAGMGLLVTGAVLGPLTFASAGTDPLSQGKPVTASSSEGAHWAASNAVDGDPTTRWSSEFADPQFIQVDLGKTATIDRVELNWENAHATAYEIMVSNDGNAFTSIYSTTTSKGGDESLAVSGTGRYVRMLGTKRSSAYGFSLFEFQVYGSFTGTEASTGPTGPTSPAASSGSASPAASSPASSASPTTSASTPATGAGYIMANPPVTGVTPSTANPPHRYFHEFQANCAPSHNQPDDPIVFPGLPGASHDHTFMGNITTHAASTTESLSAGDTLCKVPGDRSGYWMPTMLNGDQPIMPVGAQTIYYKTGVNDYTSVRPFPKGLRFVVGSPQATVDDFKNNPGYVKGFECGDSYDNVATPPACPAGKDINVRLQAPSCWDGIHLDTPDHKSHMAYPTNGVCPKDHPVAVPMIEFKMAWPVSGDTSKIRFSSGGLSSFHYDFFNAWDPDTLAAMVKQCINGGMQCNAQGYDETHPDAGSALDANYQLPGAKKALAKTGWTVTSSVGNGAANIVDGNNDSRWTSGVPMANGQSITVDMKAAHPVSMINLLGTGVDWPRAYDVSVSTDGTTWTKVDSSLGFMTQTIITFAPHDARYLKITQTGTASNWWSVAELTAYTNS